MLYTGGWHKVEKRYIFISTEDKRKTQAENGLWTKLCRKKRIALIEISVEVRIVTERAREKYVEGGRRMTREGRDR